MNDIEVWELSDSSDGARNDRKADELVMKAANGAYTDDEGDSSMASFDTGDENMSSEDDYTKAEVDNEFEAHHYALDTLGDAGRYAQLE